MCRGVVIPAGTLTGDRTLYRHLRHSVVAFDTAPEFAARPTRAGPDLGARSPPVAGWRTGIVHTFLARNGGPETTEERVL